MDIIRNFINISGLADENDLPKSVDGQIIQYSENDIIYIPDAQPEIQSVFSIMIKTEVKSSRKINTPLGTTVILDGLKRLKMIYSSKGDGDKANFLDLELPFNTFVELPKDISPRDIEIYVIDAYFSLLDGRRLYSHILYMVYVNFDLNELSKIMNPGSRRESSSEVFLNLDEINPSKQDYNENESEFIFEENMDSMQCDEKSIRRIYIDEEY